MRAKFQCTSITDNGYNKTAKLSAVYSGNPEDNSFAAATPAGELSITIDNPDTKDYFAPGKKYYLDFTEAAE